MAKLGRGTPVLPRILRGPVGTGTKFETLTDAFPSLDTNKWQNYGTTSVTGGRARIEVGTGFSAFQSYQIYTLTDSYVLVRIDTWPAASTATTAYVELLVGSDQVPSGTQLSLKADVVTGNLTAANQVGFSDGGAVSTGFSTLAPLWLRIDGRTPGSFTFDYSLTGNPSGWSNIRTITHAAAPWLTTAGLKVLIQGHRDAGVTDFVEVDDFNLPTSDPATPSPMFRSAPWKRIPGSVTFAPKGFHPGEKSPSPLVVSPFSGRKPFPLPPGATYQRALDTRPTPTYDVGSGLDGALPVPFSVRLKSDQADVLLVDELKNVSWRSVAPGGFASATITLDRPVSEVVPEVALYGRMYIYDTRDGDTLWEGRVEDPGRTSGDGGNAWTISAVGPSAHTRDEAFAAIYVDRTINHFEKFGGSMNAGKVSSETDSNDLPGVKVQFGGGITVLNGNYVSARSRRVKLAGLELGSVRAEATGGGTGTWTMDMYVYGPSGAELVDSNGLTTSTTGYYGEAGTDFSDGQTTLHLRMSRNTSSTTPDDNAYTIWTEVCVRTKLVNEEGTPVGDYTSDFVYSSEVIQDILGRHLPLFDPLDAYIEVTSFEHLQFAYDSTTAYDVFNDIMLIEDAYYWAAWETVPRNGLWRYEFRPWPTHVRYECGIEDGWSSPGSADDLYNEVLVRWEDQLKFETVTTVTASVPELTAAGLTRTAQIDLGTEVGCDSTATKAGQSYLAEHNLPNQNGRLTIARPILDYDRGMMVDPWKIRPAALIRVRDVAAKPSALNPDGRDGTTIFRVVAVNPKADGTAELELDSDAYSTSQAIATLQRKRRRR